MLINSGDLITLCTSACCLPSSLISLALINAYPEPQHIKIIIRLMSWSRHLLKPFNPVFLHSITSLTIAMSLTVTIPWPHLVCGNLFVLCPTLHLHVAFPLSGSTFWHIRMVNFNCNSVFNSNCHATCCYPLPASYVKWTSASLAVSLSVDCKSNAQWILS